ncbi:TPA: hypothetical protein UM674_002196 [Stenotrophomonas maltophilia]|nr:hypothetical protein [Stenotrophomonas maltophilia]
MNNIVAERLIYSELYARQEQIVRVFHGRNQLAIFEICRALDAVFTGASRSLVTEYEGYYIRCGVPEALAPFLNPENAQRAGYQWRQFEPDKAAMVRTYLVDCGRLIDLLRLVKLEIYGLANVNVSGRFVEVEVRSDSPERVAMDARRIVSAPERKSLPPFPNEKIWKCAIEFLKGGEFGSAYFELDTGVRDHYLDIAMSRRAMFPEAEALPDQCMLGGRAFQDWRAECERANARVLRHIDFSKVALSEGIAENALNILTPIQSRSSVERMLVAEGTPPEFVKSTVRALTTQAEDVAGYSDIFEPPSTPYISLGKDFLVAPCYGMIGNPYFSMFRHLRAKYRADWDRAVAGREVMFRADIAKLFGSRRFVVPSGGFKIKRTNGTHVTDIDAIVFDQETGSLALMQLKWHDPYGRSIVERESRRKNLAKAQEWVGRVQEWVESVGPENLCCALGLPSIVAPARPLVYVVSRYASQFVADSRTEHKSTWLSWPELQYCLRGSDFDPLLEISDLIERQRVRKTKTVRNTQEYVFSSFQAIVHADVCVNDGEHD